MSERNRENSSASDGTASTQRKSVVTTENLVGCRHIFQPWLPGPPLIDPHTMPERDSLNRDLAVRESFARDASGLWQVCEAVARPTSAAEVADLLAEANARRTPVTTAGSQTSTTGASICDHGILLSTRALSHIGPVDRDARTVRVGPGVLLGGGGSAWSGAAGYFVSVNGGNIVTSPTSMPATGFGTRSIALGGAAGAVILGGLGAGISLVRRRLASARG